jgi:hypothetical protein
MGATASRSSPTGETTRLVTVSDYSELVRVPVLEPQSLTTFRFENLVWEARVKPLRFKEGLAKSINVSVALLSNPYRPDLALKGIDVSIEVLDETGQNTVFRKDSNRTLQTSRRLNLILIRRQLEASSCLRDDSFTARCTLSKQATKWWRLFSEPKKLAAVEPQVAMSGSHMLTVSSFSKLKVALQDGGCTYSTYSTHFAVAGCRWYFQFCPAGAIGLVRASENEPPTTAEFSFELEGAVNFQSEKMIHTFDGLYDYSRYIYRFNLEPSPSAIHDRLVVRCCLTVMNAEEPRLPPAASPPIATTPCAESILTPLLGAMYD